MEGEAPQGPDATPGRAIGQAVSWRCSIDALISLQRSAIDERLIRLGLRPEGGFVGRHDAMKQPLPGRLGAKAEDLPSLLEEMSGLRRSGAQQASIPP